MAGFADVPAPMQYAPKENLGVGLANAVSSIYTGFKQGQAEQDNKEFQTAFGQAYAKNDYTAMQQLAAAHPQQWQQVQAGMSAIQDNNRQQLGAASSDLSLAAASGNPQAVLNVAQRHGQVLQGLGIAPEDLATAYQQNPQQVKQYADMLGSHALGPEQYFTMQNKTLERIQQGQYQQGQLQLGAQRVQQGQQQVDQQGQYQRGQLQQGQQRLNLDSEMNRIKTQDLQLQRQMQKGKMDQDWQAKQAASLQSKQGLVDAYDSGMNSLGNMVQTLGQVQQIDPDTFNASFGLSGTINRAIPGSAERDAYAQIEQMQSQARLMGVIGMKGTGPVSDSEGQAAARAFLALDPKTSAKAARRAIDNWNSVLQRQLAYQKSRQPQIEQYRSQIQSATQQAQQGQQAPQQQGVGGAGGGAVSWNSLK